MKSMWRWLRRRGLFGKRPAPVQGTGLITGFEPYRKIGLHCTYPIRFVPTPLEEQAAAGARFSGTCPICGHETVFDFPAGFADTLREAMGSLWQGGRGIGSALSLLRETGACAHCHSANRERQVAYFLNETYKLKKCLSFADSVVLFNAETAGVLHAHLARNKGYRCSEYLGPDYVSGQTVNGVLHEDLQALSFPDNSVDVVITRDVLEHVPDPYRAQQEIFRVLKPGGRHVFTAPFYGHLFFDETRAREEQDGTKHLLPPLYHLNPMDPERGSLVYTIFALEMLLKLNRLGFLPALWHIYAPQAGIIGTNALLFEATKPAK